MTEKHDDALGRRERGKRERAARIAAAAAELFAQHAVDEVSTQAIAAAADVAEGTLFRYAANKTELLVMALNTQFAGALETGLAAADKLPTASVAQRVEALSSALLSVGAARPGNAALYQRELLFATHGGTYVDAGVAIAGDWQRAVVQQFLGACATQDEAGTARAQLAGSAAWDVIQLAVAKRAHPESARHSAPDLAGTFQLLAQAVAGAEVVN